MTVLLDVMSERISILVKQDHLAQLANARTPLEAIAELVWNAFDADATTVTVSFTTNALDALDEIRVTDNGHGIFHRDAKQLFGNLGDSWKRSKRRTDGGRSIHGKQGKGRFKAFFLGTGATWNTTFRLEDGSLYDYSITGDYATLNAFTVSAPTPAQGIATGTEVVIRNPHRNFRSLLEDEVRLLAAQHFGAYLTEYPSLSLIFNGERIDPQVAQARSTEVNLELAMPDGQTLPAALRIIEWKQETDRLLHLCDDSGVSCHSVVLGPGLKAKGFSFTAYLKTALVRELDRQHRLELDDLDENVKTLVQAGRDTLRAYFKQREIEESSGLVARWQSEGVYPYEDGQLGPVESPERQVFDSLASTLSGHLKAFEGLDPAAKRFTFRLMAHALRENPAAIRSLITEGLNLNKADQDHLAAVFGKSPLPQLASSTQVIRTGSFFSKTG
ncbi:MAG: ATP-binding protein [Opitutaceae bacterium]|nr:ATP-binding protein [Opitutaceae bacterium]